MKINITNILLVVLITILIYQNFFKQDKVTPPQVVTVQIPESNGTTGVQVVEKIVEKVVKVHTRDTTFIVDATLKKKYEDAKDSITKLNLYLDAIKINEYKKTVVSNDTIDIIGYIKTRGSLLSYKVDYTIKPQSITYVPEIITQRPRLSLGLSLQTGIPTMIGTDFLVKGGISLINRKGFGFNTAYDNNKRVWFGLSKTFTLLN